MGVPFDPPKILREMFRAARSPWVTGALLAAEIEEFRGLYDQIEQVRRDPEDAELLSLANACVRAGALAKDQHGRPIHPEALDFHSAARHAMAEVLLDRPRSRKHRQLAADLLADLPPSGWIADYLECLRELTDKEGQREVARGLLDRALRAAEESRAEAFVLRGLHALRRALEAGVEMGSQAPQAGEKDDRSSGESTGPSDLPEWLTAEDMAPVLRLSERRVRRLMTEGKIPSRLFGRRRFTRREDFESLLAPEQKPRQRRK